MRDLLPAPDLPATLLTGDAAALRHLVRAMAPCLTPDDDGPINQSPFLALQTLLSKDIESEAPEPLTEPAVDLLYRVVLGRRPESRAVVAAHVASHRSVGAFIAALVSSPEWRMRLPSLFLDAFADHGRVLHVHIPKTAGTALFAAADRSGWGILSLNQLQDSALRPETPAKALRPPQAGRRILVSGHHTLDAMEPWLRPFDVAITLVRDPVDRLLSFFNFMCDVVDNIGGGHSRDRAQEFLAAGLVPGDLERTWANGVFRANEQCAFLSSSATCADALRRCALLDCAVFPVERSTALGEVLFGAPLAQSVNASSGRVTRNALRPAFEATLIAANAEDLALHRAALVAYAGIATDEPSR